MDTWASESETAEQHTHTHTPPTNVPCPRAASLTSLYFMGMFRFTIRKLRSVPSLPPHANSRVSTRTGYIGCTIGLLYGFRGLGLGLGTQSKDTEHMMMKKCTDSGK